MPMQAGESSSAMRYQGKRNNPQSYSFTDLESIGIKASKRKSTA